METIKYKKLMKQLGNFVSVKNLPSRINGTAPNQFELTFENGVVFQSYESLIGVKMNGKKYFTALHNYSNTTSGYCTRWCGYNAKERKEKLMNGEFILIEM